MRIRLGLLREYLSEALEEQAMVPGRWYGGEEPVGDDRERVGDPLGIDETDARMVDDDRGNGVGDPNDPDDIDIADHLRGDEEKTSLGDPPDETIEEELAFVSALLKEDPAVASGSDPTDVHGLYTPFDMTRDHMGTDDLSATWYRSPGREPGGDGDPFRGPDPNVQLGFHTTRAQDDPAASPPAVDGDKGIAARQTPPIWQLSGGSDTSAMLGANAKDPSASVDSESESEEEKEPGEADDEEGAGGQEQG
jgi:hypothetical protein